MESKYQRPVYKTPPQIYTDIHNNDHENRANFEVLWVSFASFLHVFVLLSNFISISLSKYVTLLYVICRDMERLRKDERKDHPGQIMMIREGILNVGVFHYSLQDWQLTRASIKAKKAATKKQKGCYKLDDPIRLILQILQNVYTFLLFRSQVS